MHNKKVSYPKQIMAAYSSVAEKEAMYNEMQDKT